MGKGYHIIHVTINCTQLPDVCTNQPVNYTFIIETEENDTAIVILEGPYFHIGPGLVPHCVNGLHKYRNYSIFVQVNSIAGSSESDKLYFGKNHSNHNINNYSDSVINV